LILLKYLLKINEIAKLPNEQTEKKNINVSKLSTPINITCKTFMNVLIQTMKAAVELACIAESFSLLSIGIKKIPPPKPKPLKIPAQKLPIKIYLIF